MSKIFPPRLQSFFALRIVLATLLILVSLSYQAQENKRLKKAIEKYEFNEYTEAIALFKKILKDNQTAYTPLKYVAASYRKIKDYQNAELYYTLVINSDSANAEDYFNYGQTLLANNKLAAAKEQFDKFGEKSNNKFLSELMVQSFNEMEKWEKESTNFKSTPINNQLNTALSEYNLVQFNNKYYITSNRQIDYNSPEVSSWTGDPFLSIYEIDTNLLGSAEGKFELVAGRLNTEYHDGPITIDSSKQKAIITRVDNQLRGKNYVNHMKLFEGEFSNDKWKNFKELPFVNDKFHFGHASYGMDNLIYFSSNMDGGIGGMDLYSSQKKNGEWSVPKNLGPSINTKGDEIFPYFKNDQLYFSSNGFAGYGGLDLFVSKYNGGWQSPINLKKPINSNKDDFGIYFITDSTGYYASDRDGGKGKDDIYSFYRSSKTIAVGVSGIFEYKGLPVEGTKIYVTDANDSIIAVNFTDEKGRFQFNQLAYQQDYFFQVETEDQDILKSGRLFLTDNKGDKIRLIERLRNGKFKFAALPSEEIVLQQMAEEDLDELGELRFVGQVYKKLPGDFTKTSLVYLVDEDGAIVDSVLTDDYGNFNFSKLALDNNKNYFVKVKTEEEDDLNLALINDDGRVFEITEAVDGKFILTENSDAEALSIKNKGLTSLIGLVELNGKPVANQRVQLFNSRNELVATIFTNAKGQFQFNKLKVDQTYLASLPDVEDKEGSAIYVINKNGDPLYLINQLKEGGFAFNALPLEEYNKIQEEEASSVPDFVELTGQLFKKLPGDYDDELKVYLLDEKGAIIDSVYTDKTGKFQFEKLDPDRNYTFRLEENEEANLVLLGKEDQILEQAILNDQGNFTYKKLTYQVAKFEPLELVDAELVEDELTHEIYGQVFQKLPGDFDNGMEVYIYDEDGKLVGTALTDEKGKFKFKKLDSDKEYFFRIEHAEEDFQLVTLDEELNVLDKTIKNSRGEFKYKPLGLDHHEFLLEETEDHHQIVHIDNKRIDLDTFTVHYRFDSTLLNTIAMQTLNEFIKLFKNEPVSIQVQSHTDNRGPASYNELLSKKRTDSVIDYLMKKGIAPERILGNYFGEMKPAVDCATKKCNNNDHYLNRRTELKLIKQD